jgi:hypothetical protein
LLADAEWRCTDTFRELKTALETSEARDQPSPLGATVNLFHIQAFSTYRAVNTHRLGYKNQSVIAV